MTQDIDRVADDLIGRCAVAYRSHPDKYRAWPALLRELASQHDISTGENDLAPGYTAWLGRGLVADGYVTSEEMAAMCGLILIPAEVTL